MEFGFDTLVSSTTLPTKECNNLMSIRRQPEIVSNLLREECKKGYAYGPYGPFRDAPFDCYRISPIGVATRKYSGKKRLIIDLSAPHDDSTHSSINDLIDKEQCSLTDVKLDDAIKKISQVGTRAML